MIEPAPTELAQAHLMGEFWRERLRDKQRGYAEILWSTACEVSNSISSFTDLLRSFPHDVKIEGFKILGRGTNGRTDYTSMCLILLSSTHFPGTLDKPTKLCVEVGPRIRPIVNGKA